MKFGKKLRILPKINMLQGKLNQICRIAIKVIQNYPLGLTCLPPPNKKIK